MFSKLSLSIRNAAFLSLLLTIGCAGSYKQALDFNPGEPLRVAVLPFVTVDDKGQVTTDEGRLLIDNVGLLSTKQEETPPQIVRRLVLGELGKTSLDIVAPPLIDLDLPHHGFALPDGKLDMKKVLATSPKELCEKFLNCDAVLYGRIVKWDRSYYAVQSVSTVGVDLKLVSARDGKTLYSAVAEDSDSRGLTKGPTGFSDIVIEPIRGLDSDIIVDLSRKVVKKMVEPLNVKSRPVFLEAAPPSIFAVSHDGPNGVVDRGNPVRIVMFASDGQSASFSIGSAVEKIPMIERSPGHYYGEYVPLPSDSFDSQTVKATLTDKYGRSTEQAVESKRLTLVKLPGDTRARLK